MVLLKQTYTFPSGGPKSVSSQYNKIDSFVTYLDCHLTTFSPKHTPSLFGFSSFCPFLPVRRSTVRPCPTVTLNLSHPPGVVGHRTHNPGRTDRKL